MNAAQHAAPVHVTSVTELDALVGTEVGISTWHEVTQAEVNAFADATGDQQWIHTDPERASASAFRGTIAHGYYTLSLAPVLITEVLPLDGFAMAVNYGLDKLRFPAPMAVGASLRMRVGLDRIDRFPGGATLAVKLTFESTGSERPVCVADALYRVMEAEAEPGAEPGEQG